MDWLKGKWKAFRNRMFHLSLKKALAMYIAMGTAGTLLAMALIGSFSQNMLNSLEWKYFTVYEEVPYEVPPSVVLPGEEGIYDEESYEKQHINYVDTYSKMDGADRALKEMLDMVQTWSPFVCVIGGVACVCLLFYKNKLKRPLQLLEDSTEKIAANDLEFRCEYGSEDEMGRLCAGFEKMRGSLKENHQKMWDMMEEQRRLNHAFAHDLRTPLTVLHGYIDFLTTYYPEGRVSREKLMETLAMMDRQVLRLKRFGDTMKSVGSLEDRRAVKKETTGSAIFAALKSMAAALDGTGGVHIWVDQRIPSEKRLYLDEELFLETVENILSNGLRYGKKWVQVILTNEGDFLEVYVKDDGPGFTEEGLRMAAKPYYKDKEETEKEHFGIGLYICRVLCEKHGGSLSLHNGVDGGAIVSAYFCAKNEGASFPG